MDSDVLLDVAFAREPFLLKIVEPAVSVANRDGPHIAAPKFVKNSPSPLIFLFRQR